MCSLILVNFKASIYFLGNSDSSASNEFASRAMMQTDYLIPDKGHNPYLAPQTLLGLVLKLALNPKGTNKTNHFVGLLEALPENFDKVPRQCWSSYISISPRMSRK